MEADKWKNVSIWFCNSLLSSNSAESADRAAASYMEEWRSASTRLRQPLHGWLTAHRTSVWDLIWFAVSPPNLPPRITHPIHFNLAPGWQTRFFFFRESRDIQLLPSQHKIKCEAKLHKTQSKLTNKTCSFSQCPRCQNLPHYSVRRSWTPGLLRRGIAGGVKDLFFAHGASAL